MGGGIVLNNEKNFTEKLSISLSKETMRILNEMCEDDVRNKSNFIEWLIIKEYRNREKK